MPELSPAIKTQIAAWLALQPKDRHYAELVAIYWPAPTNTIVYASADYDILPGYEDLAARLESDLDYTDPVVVPIKPGSRSPFVNRPKTAAVGDDKVDFTFSDLDGEFSTLLMTHGEGIRVEIFDYLGGVDLLLSQWRGSLHAPKEMNRPEVKVSAAVGFRSAQLQIPRRPHSLSCPFIFGAHLLTQAEIDYHQGCPYNRHLGGAIGTLDPATGLPWTDCPRANVSQCVARLATDLYWPGFQTRPDPIPNNQTKGPNLLARAYGNESNLNDPIRVLFGYRMVKALNLLAFRPEINNNHPEDGFGDALFEIAEGPLYQLWGFRINGILVADEHQQKRLGTLGQLPTNWSPDVNSYSGTAHCWGRIQGDFSQAGASDYDGTIWAGGLSNVRIYTTPTAFTQGFTKNRMWCILEAYCNPRWGYGVDYSRVDIQSCIDAAAWCDETVEMRDSNGNLFGGVRSTCNAELTARPTAQQIQDLCAAGRIGLPFEWQGKDYFYPLKTEGLVDVPVFTDEGDDRNILYDGAKSSLVWSQVSDAELTNQWTVNFDDESNHLFVDTQLIFGDQLQQLRAGRAWGDRSRRVVDKKQAAFGITNFLETARLGYSLLYLGPLDSGGIANNFRVKFQTWHSHAFGLHNYKIIKVLNTKLQARILQYGNARFAGRPDTYPWYQGIAYTYFRILKIERKGDLKVEIEAQLYPEDWYAIIDGIEVVEEPCEVDFITAVPPVSGEVIQFPSSVAVGDHLLVSLDVDSETDPTGPALLEFTLINHSIVDLGANNKHHYVYLKIAEDAGEQSYDFSVVGATGRIFGAVVREAHPTDWMWQEAADKIDNASGTELSITGLNVPTEVDSSMTLIFVASESAVTATTPTGFTERLDAGGVQLFTRLISPAGSQGTPTFDLSLPASSSAYAITLTPCEGTPGLPPPPPLQTVPGDPVLTLGLEIRAGVLGPENVIHGTVTFPSFPGPLRGDIFVTPPGGVETLIHDNLSPVAGSFTAQFDYVAQGFGVYSFRVTIESTTDPPVAGGEDTESIAITGFLLAEDDTIFLAEDGGGIVLEAGDV